MRCASGKNVRYDFYVDIFRSECAHNLYKFPSRSGQKDTRKKTNNTTTALQLTRDSSRMSGWTTHKGLTSRRRTIIIKFWPFRFDGRSFNTNAQRLRAWPTERSLQQLFGRAMTELDPTDRDAIPATRRYWSRRRRCGRPTRVRRRTFWPIGRCRGYTPGTRPGSHRPPRTTS